MSFLRTYLEPHLASHRFQHQAYDHVFREHERRQNVFATACNYVLANPIRAQLVTGTEDWVYRGSIVPGYPTLQPRQEDFWPKFWKIYRTAKSADAGNILRPPVAQ